MNKEALKQKNKLYYEKNKVLILETRRVYYEQNKEEIIVKNSIYSQNHRDDRREYEKVRRDNDKVRINKVKAEYEKQKRQDDPAHKLRKNISRMVNIVLHKDGLGKNNSSILQFLSYSTQELKEHLEKQFEPWMTWDNYGVYKAKQWDENDPTTWTWQIDHIIPQSKLPYAAMADDNFQKCWALENLRPLSAKQNIIDGNRR